MQAGGWGVQPLVNNSNEYGKLRIRKIDKEELNRNNR
jgi:hypothetical protein